MKNEIENAQNGATIWQQQQQQNEKHSMTNELIPKMALNATCLNTSKVQENRLPKWIARNDGAKTTHQTKQTTTWRIQLLCKYLCCVFVVVVVVDCLLLNWIPIYSVVELLHFVCRTVKGMRMNLRALYMVVRLWRRCRLIICLNWENGVCMPMRVNAEGIARAFEWLNYGENYGQSNGT